MLRISRLIFSNRCFILDYSGKKIMLVTMMAYNGHTILHFGETVFFHLMVQFKQVRRLPNFHLPLINKNLLLVQPEVVCPKTLRYSDSSEQYEFLPSKIPDKTFKFSVFGGVPTLPNELPNGASPPSRFAPRKYPLFQISTY